VSDKGQPLNGVFDIRPASVSVTPGLVPAPQARQGVLIEPQYDSTQPAFGYEVAGTEVHPSTVTITGPSAILAATTTVSTKPISLEGLASDATIPVQLDLPHGVRAVHAGTITVRVRIRRMKMKSPPSTAIEAPEPANPAP
jgi:YbbR domain-containing protein